MQKLFFAVLIIITLLVAARLYRQHHTPEQPIDLSSLSNIATQQQLPAPDDENDSEFEEEHPEITANDEETLIEED